MNTYMRRSSFVGAWYDFKSDACCCCCCAAAVIVAETASALLAGEGLGFTFYVESLAFRSKIDINTITTRSTTLLKHADRQVVSCSSTYRNPAPVATYNAVSVIHDYKLQLRVSVCSRGLLLSVGVDDAAIISK